MLVSNWKRVPRHKQQSNITENLGLGEIYISCPHGRREEGRKCPELKAQDQHGYLLVCRADFDLLSLYAWPGFLLLLEVLGCLQLVS